LGSGRRHLRSGISTAQPLPRQQRPLNDRLGSGPAQETPTVATNQLLRDISATSLALAASRTLSPGSR
jgi:hypothetical protein